MTLPSMTASVRDVPRMLSPCRQWRVHTGQQYPLRRAAAGGQSIRAWGIHLLLIQPHGITPYHVIDTEIARGIWPLDVRVPAVIHLLPGHRQQRRILFDAGFRLPNERLALRCI